MTTKSDATNTTPDNRPYDPVFGLQEKVASLLVPVFKTADTDERFAYQIACRSLEAYEPETRPDFLNAGRTIAFSLAALALLGQAADPAMHLDAKLRILGQANALNRSADQSERSMMERRRYQRAYPAFPEHQPVAPTPEPVAAEIQTEPPKPQTNPEPPPIQIAPPPYAAPHHVNIAPNRMFHPVNQYSPAPHPGNIRIDAQAHPA